MREFFTSMEAEPVTFQRLILAAGVRLYIIFPVVFLFTFLSMLYLKDYSNHPQAVHVCLVVWSILALTYVVSNALLYFFPVSGTGLPVYITYVSIFGELATNQVVMYFSGSLTSHTILFVIIIVAVYRVFLNFHYSLIAAILGGIMFCLVALLEIFSIIPLSPGLPFPVEHPVYTEGFAGIFIAAVLMGIFVAFFSTNYGMNQALKLQRELEKQSMLDGLTGIANRRRFDAVLEVEWKRAQRNQTYLSLLMIDVDAFKAYNDNYGHLSGDECLKAIAGALSSTLKRAADLAARYGGEEFVVLLPETAPENALHVAKKIRKAIVDLKLEHKFSPLADYITVSVGVSSTIPVQNLKHQELLLEAADNALYEAKQSGRNMVKQKEV